MQNISVLAIYPNQFASEYLHFLEPRTNSIIDGYFSKLMFGNELFLTNGLTICIPVHLKSIFSEHLDMLRKIEIDILSIYSDNPVNPTQSRIVEYLQSKYTACNILAPQGLTENILIKISGVWENKQGAVGLSFRCSTI